MSNTLRFTGYNASGQPVEVPVAVSDSGGIILGETVGQRHNRYATGIGYASGTAVEVTFTQSENVRRYRCKPSADMRVAEDAANVLQAESWLSTGVARANSPATDVEYMDLVQDVWSEWKEISKDPSDISLSSLWFSLDAAGTGAAVVVEAE